MSNSSTPAPSIRASEADIEALAPLSGRRTMGLSLPIKPVLRYSSGARHRAHRELFREFQAENYANASRVLAEKEHAFTDFQRSVLSWLLSGITGKDSEIQWRRVVEKLAQTPLQCGVYYENRAFFLIQEGRYDEAVEMCDEGLRGSPTTEGLWINLLVSLDRLHKRRAIDVVLGNLPRVFVVDCPTLRLYLMNDPYFESVMCNGG